MSYYSLISLMPKTPAVDPDAQAFITAASITDPTQQSAINQLVVDLKGYNIWTKFKAIYPFCGSTASQHKWNLKDPRDLDVAFRLVFNGGWTHSSTGATPNGTNGYADTFFNPNTSASLNSHSLSYYSRTNATNAAVEIGVGANNVGNYNILELRTTNTTYFGINSTLGTYADSDSRAFYLANRQASNDLDLWKQGVKVVNGTTASTSLLNGKIYLGAMNSVDIASAQFYSTKQTAFASIGDGLTDTEAANFYTAVQTFQVSLGRSIGTQTVSDADAQAFVTNAGIVDQVEANAVNNLVIGLKADGLWTKMKACYPMVGGVATSHQYNLKNTSTFTLTFFGGWTHSSTGATPNGTNAYADTFLTPNLAFNTTTFNHLSYYSRSNTAKTAEYVMGAFNGIGNHGLIIRRDTNLGFFVADYATSTSFRSAGGTGVTDGRGLFLGSQTGTNAKLYRNGSVIYNNTGVTLNNAIPNNKIFIGALNETGMGSFTDKQCAFASIGEGLSDTDATNLNTRVTTFQTALNRNV
jgi:hypothetical protein